MSSTFTRKPGRTSSNASPEAVDPDSFDLDLFDQLANQPRKKSRGIRFRELAEDEELPETDTADDEMNDGLERDDFVEDYDEEPQEEYVPVRSRRTTVSRTPAARTSASSRSTSRTPFRSSRNEDTAAVRSSRMFSTVSGRSLASDAEETASSTTSRATSGRSTYGFPVRTTAQSGMSSSTNNGSASFATSTGYPVNNDNHTDDTSLSAPTSLSADDLKALQPKPRKKTNPLLSFCKALIIVATVFAGIWAIYGVSVESNLGFWQQTFKSEIAYVHDTLGSLPSPLLMMIDQP